MGVCMQGMCMDAMRTLQEQEHRTRRLLAALDEHQHLVGVYQGSEEALAQHCGALQEQLAALHADRAEIHASLLVRAPPSPMHAAGAPHACLWPRASACWCTRDSGTRSTAGGLGCTLLNHTFWPGAAAHERICVRKLTCSSRRDPGGADAGVRIAVLMHGVTGICGHAVDKLCGHASSPGRQTKANSRTLHSDDQGGMLALQLRACVRVCVCVCVRMLACGYINGCAWLVSLCAEAALSILASASAFAAAAGHASVYAAVSCLAVQEARETVRRREAETAGRWSMLSEAAAVHFEAAGATLEQLSDATSALVALKQAQEECVTGWGAALSRAAAALQAATEPVVEALEGVLQKQEVLQVRCPPCRGL